MRLRLGSWWGSGGMGMGWECWCMGSGELGEKVQMCSDLESCPAYYQAGYQVIRSKPRRRNFWMGREGVND